jgi:hypothetical protein
VLLGAVIAAYMPTLAGGNPARQRQRLAVPAGPEVLQQLARASATTEPDKVSASRGDAASGVLKRGRAAACRPAYHGAGGAKRVARSLPREAAQRYAALTGPLARQTASGAGCHSLRFSGKRMYGKVLPC